MEHNYEYAGTIVDRLYKVVHLFWNYVWLKNPSINMEVKKQFQIELSKRSAALEN